MTLSVLEGGTLQLPVLIGRVLKNNKIYYSVLEI